jgi:hypothetical protein
MTSPAPQLTNPYVASIVDQAFIGLTMLLRTLRIWSAKDEGLDESPSKLLYIALGIIVAGIVAGIAYSIVQQAGDNIPDPVVPAGP